MSKVLSFSVELQVVIGTYVTIRVHYKMGNVLRDVHFSLDSKLLDFQQIGLVSWVSIAAN